MTKRRISAAALLAGLALVVGCAKEKEDDAAEAAKPAAAPAPLPGTQSYAIAAPDSLRALARVSLDSAVRLALARVPGGLIDKAELEREDGAVIWSFDIRVPGQAGISEIGVNAVTGAALPMEHENAAAEAREAREDSTAARRPAAPATKRP